MNIKKAIKRDEKRKKRKNGPVTDSRSVFVIRDEIGKRAKKIKRQRLDKNAE